MVLHSWSSCACGNFHQARVKMAATFNKLELVWHALIFGEVWEATPRVCSLAATFFGFPHFNCSGFLIFVFLRCIWCFVLHLCFNSVCFVSSFIFTYLYTTSLFTLLDHVSEDPLLPAVSSARCQQSPEGVPHSVARGLWCGCRWCYCAEFPVWCLLCAL